MERAILIAAVGTVTALLFRNEHREFSVIVGAISAILVMMIGVGSFTGIAKTLEKICSSYGLSLTVIEAALKILGISYLTEFGASFTRDAGQNAIASNLELCGRIMILSCVLPSGIALLEAGTTLLKEVMS